MATRHPAMSNPNITSYLDLLIFSHYYLITFYLKYLELQGGIMNSSKIDGFFPGHSGGQSFGVFFFSGHSNALHLFQMRKSCGNVTKLYCSIHPVQTQEGVTLKGQHYYLLFFFLHLRLNSYFPALFLLTGFQVPWRRNKSNCLDNTKRSKLFWPCLCLCNPCMCDAGK